jgi:hypothetical protein
MVTVFGSRDVPLFAALLSKRSATEALANTMDALKSPTSKASDTQGERLTPMNS